MAIFICFGHTCKIFTLTVSAIITAYFPIRIQEPPPPGGSTFNTIINLCVGNRDTRKTCCISLYGYCFTNFIGFGVVIQLHLKRRTLVFFNLNPFLAVLASYGICARLCVFRYNEVVVPNAKLICLYYGTSYTVPIAN